MSPKIGASQMIMHVITSKCVKFPITFQQVPFTLKDNFFPFTFEFKKVLKLFALPLKG
jgi:hypothetical protein